MLKKFLVLVLCLALTQAQTRTKTRGENDGDTDQADDEETVKSKPVIIRLPKNRLSPEIHPISSLSEQPATELPTAIEKPSATLAPAPSLSPIISRVSPVPSAPRVSLRPEVPQPPRQPQLQAPQQALSSNPLISNALASGNGLAGILSNNPSLAKLLQNLGGAQGLAGANGPPGINGISPGFGQGGLLAPLQGARPSLAQPPAFPGPPGVSDNGLLNVLSSFGRQLGGAVGLNNIIPGGGNPSAVGPSIPRISANAPPVPGLPNIPGVLPVFPGAISPGGQLDVVQLVSAISRRAFNGSSVTDVLPPTQIQKLADNLTNVLLPETPEIDLNKYMGRWFEGIGSPRATDQRCVVHHYGGLTENGKTATFTALKIYREASEFGQVRYSIGYSFRGGRQEGMMQMHTSEATDPIPYWIYKVGPVGKDPFGNEQYEYAVVSNWIRYPVTVLVRDPDQFKRDHEESVLRWLEEKGFINGFIRAFNLIQPVSYQNCQYADSTFELFG